MGKLVFSFTLLLSLLIVIRALIDFLTQISQLRTREVRIEFELGTRSAELPGRQARVQKLLLVLPPLKRKFQEMYNFYSAVKEVEQAAEKEEIRKDREAITLAQEKIKSKLWDEPQIRQSKRG